MEKLMFLNSKETKGIIDIIKRQFGYEGDLDYLFLKSVKNNIYLVNKEVRDLDLDAVRINSIGMYLGELSGNSLRLSIEGSQLIGPESLRNIINLNHEEMIDWMRGKDLPREEGEPGFKLLKNNNDFLGCATLQNAHLLNFVPKVRRLNLDGDYFE